MTRGPSEPHRLAWQVCSALLDYPDERSQAQLPLIRAAVDALPDRLGQPLRRYLDEIGDRPVLDRAAHYTAVFDHQRRCCLYLTYYAHGDTRNRGMALLAFKRTYAQAGLALADGELPDHLAVVLEYAATVDEESARRVLMAHRAGIELLRLALRDAGSPYEHVLDAVCTTLPPLRGDEHEAVARLAAEGPPAEEVGLDPFQMPSRAMPAARR